jgi:hypothetical protein
MNTKKLLAIVVIATAALTALGSLGIGTAIIAPASAQNMSGGGGNMTGGNMTADTSDSISTPSGEGGEGSAGGDGGDGGYQQ